LAEPQWEIPAQAETFFRGIEDEAREPALIAVQIDDQTSALLRHHAIGTASVWGWNAGHCYGGLTSDILTGVLKPVFLFVQRTQGRGTGHSASLREVTAAGFSSVTSTAAMIPGGAFWGGGKRDQPDSSGMHGGERWSLA
jgi:hypothetical protein